MHSGGKFQWMNWIGGSNQQHSVSYGAIPTGKWLHMRMEFKFASNGYFRHFIDGVLVSSWTGQVGDGSGQYLKLGTNGWMSTAAASRAYYDNLKVYKKQ
jgi:hypothetical protein